MSLLLYSAMFTKRLKLYRPIEISSNLLVSKRRCLRNANRCAAQGVSHRSFGCKIFRDALERAEKSLRCIGSAIFCFNERFSAPFRNSLNVLIKSDFD